MIKLCKFTFFSIIFLSLSSSIFAQNRAASDYFEQGLLFGKQGKYVEALEAFRQSVQLDPMQAAAHGNIANALFALGRVDESIAPAREAIRLSPTDSTFRIALCRSLSLMKNHAEAIFQCDEAVRLSGGTIEAQTALIAALRTAKRMDEALQKAEIAVRKFTDNEILLVFSAELNKQTGNYTRALELYEMLARLHPTSAVYQINMAEEYLRFERDSEAIASARKALELDSRHPLGHFYLGRVFFELGQNDEAAQSFQKASELDQNFQEAFYGLGAAHARRNDLTKAISALRRAVTLAPDNFDYNRELGATLQKDKRFEESLVFLRKADLINPKHLETKVALGFVLMSLAKFDEALEAVLQADRLQPGNTTIQMILDVTRARREGMARIEMLKREVARNPKNVDARQELTEMLVYLHRKNEAGVAINELIPLLPRTNKNLTLIGVLYSEMGMEEKAVEYHRKAVEVEPHHVIYMSLAVSLQKLGRVTEADQAYKKALEIKPDSVNVLKLYADFLRDSGKRLEALEMYKRVVEAEPTNSPSLYNLSALYIKTGNLALAKQYYEILKMVDPAQAKILNRLMRLK